MYHTVHYTKLRYVHIIFESMLMIFNRFSVFSTPNIKLYLSMFNRSKIDKCNVKEAEKNISERRRGARWVRMYTENRS